MLSKFFIKVRKNIATFIVALLTISPALNANAIWNILVYIEAYSHLSPDALINLKQMQAVGSTSNVNVIAQVNLPNNTISSSNDTSSNGQTFRYFVQKGKLVDVTPHGLTMGNSPVQELESFVSWAQSAHPSQYTSLILWSDGSGALDPARSKKQHKSRGILFDDATGTFVSDEDLSAAITAINKTLGHKLDILHMDACLMASVEILYQLKDLISVYVASEQTEPGTGLPYDLFLKCINALTPNTMTPANVGRCAIQTYNQFYRGQGVAYTLSAADPTKLGPIVTQINTVAQALQACYSLSKSQTQALLQAVVGTENNPGPAILANSDDPTMTYFDLWSFFNNLSNIAQAWLRKGSTAEPRLAPQYSTALNKVVTAISPLINTLHVNIPNLIDAAIIARASDVTSNGMHGLSIYAPIAPATIFPTYKDTAFAQNTLWVQILHMLQGN